MRHAKWAHELTYGLTDRIEATAYLNIAMPRGHGLIVSSCSRSTNASKTSIERSQQSSKPARSASASLRSAELERGILVRHYPVPGERDGYLLRGKGSDYRAYPLQRDDDDYWTYRRAIPPNGEGLINRRNPNFFWACDDDRHHMWRRIDVRAEVPHRPIGQCRHSFAVLALMANRTHTRLFCAILR